MREMHLFAGAGGGILGGMLLGHTPVCAVEFAPYCRDVLRARQSDGSLPHFPIFNDVCDFDGKPWKGKVDVVCGGFPCQPWSSAGQRKGVNDERHLWPEMARIVEEVRPRYVFAENVSLAAFEQPWRDLRRLGYRVPPALCLSAADVGAPHLRKRWWLLAADADCGGKHVRSVDAEACGASKPLGASWWATEPDVGRVANGVASRVDRLRALGNGQVPQCAAEAFRILMEQMGEVPC